MSEPLLDAIRIVIRLGRIAQQACEEAGLSMPQYRALNSISHGRQRSYELARFTAVTRPAASALTAGLVRQRLLERSDAETDGRGVTFVVSVEGREAMERAEALLTARFTAVLGPLVAGLAVLAGPELQEALDREADRQFGPTKPG